MRYVIRIDFTSFTSEVVWEGNCRLCPNVIWNCSLITNMKTFTLFYTLPFYACISHLPLFHFYFSLVFIHVLYCFSWTKYLSLFALTYSVAWGTRELFFCYVSFVSGIFFLPSNFNFCSLPFQFPLSICLSYTLPTKCS